MTLPVSPPASLSFSQVNTELQLSSTTLISLNQSTVRTLAGQTTPGSQISFSQLSGKSYVIAANSGIITSGSSYTLPATSGTSINILAIAGGGGGGGGSTRNARFAGYNIGAGGGGAGGNAYATVSVTPGQTISFSIGGAGSAGAPRNGVYTSGSYGTAGGNTSITVSGTVRAATTGGGFGYVSPDSTAGYAGGLSTGTQAITPNAGGEGYSNNQFVGQGGVGAAGYTINTTVGLSIGSIIGYGSTGPTYYAGSSSSSGSGTIYGAGGGGGGTNQSDEQNPANAYPAPGTVGAVFIWWGY
jgi:hypothetical protein